MISEKILYSVIYMAFMEVTLVLVRKEGIGIIQKN